LVVLRVAPQPVPPPVHLFRSNASLEPRQISFGRRRDHRL
jgi:hypothetical protein